jgi:NAD(P)-dependent dehydrogenase (short-subunit alcohol dehydrogenase family)
MARGLPGLEGAQRDVAALGGAPQILPADVADADAVAAQAEAFERASGPIDVWINGAMTTMFSPLSEMSAAEFRRVTEVTYLGQVHGVMAALKHMGPRDRGTIVAIGSALAYRAIPLQSAYCGAKFAIRGFMDALRSELLHDRSGIRICMVHLPAVNTPQFDWARNRLRGRPRPLAPVFQPEPIAEQIFRAARRAPRELWIGLPTMKAILGNMAVPAWLDRKLARSCYPGQQSDERAEAGRADNLFEPIPEDRGAHGRFDGEAEDAVHAASGDVARATVGAGIGAALLAALHLASRRRP